MGSHSSVLDQGSGSVTETLIPEPSVYKEDTFVFVHYCTEQVSYQSLRDVVSNLPCVFTSEIVNFECNDSKQLLVLSGLDPTNQALTEGIIIEVFEKSVLIQMGPADIICELLKSENPVLVSSGLLSEGSCNGTFEKVVKNLYKVVKVEPTDLKATIDGLFSVTKTGITPN